MEVIENVSRFDCNNTSIKYCLFATKWRCMQSITLYTKAAGNPLSLCVCSLISFAPYTVKSLWHSCLDHKVIWIFLWLISFITSQKSTDDNCPSYASTTYFSPLESIVCYNNEFFYGFCTELMTSKFTIWWNANIQSRLSELKTSTNERINKKLKAIQHNYPVMQTVVPLHAAVSVTTQLC